MSTCNKCKFWHQLPHTKLGVCYRQDLGEFPLEKACFPRICVKGEKDQEGEILSGPEFGCIGFIEKIGVD